MYKVYIETKNNNNEIIMKEVAENIERELLKQDNIIVYINGLNVDREEIDYLDLDAYIGLQDESQVNGFEVMLNSLSKVSNGLAKEIYKEMQKIYYDKTIDKGVLYVDKKIGVKEGPSVIVNIINGNYEKEIIWLQQNIDKVAKAISKGIVTSFGLKQC